MRQLIVNADDFGLSMGANRAILTAWKDGILTSASLMVGGDACDEAVSMAKDNPDLQVGLHLTLVQGKGLLPPSGFPSLVDHNREFSDDPVHAGMRYFFVRSLRKQLAAEIEAQILKFLDAGLPLTHIDGHQNIHMHPTVFDILVPLMQKYGITSFRLTRERLGAELRLAPRRYAGKCAEAFIFDRLSRRCGPVLDRLGIRYALEVKGLLNSGRMTVEYLLKLLKSLQEGVTEIYFHPGCLPDAELTRRMPGYCHEGELAALTSPKTREKLVAEGIRLRNYRGEFKGC